MYCEIVLDETVCWLARIVEWIW